MQPPDALSGPAARLADLVVDLVLGPAIDDLPTTPLATAQTAPSASGAVSATQKVGPRRVD